MTTTQVAKVVSTGRSLLRGGTTEVPARVNSYHGGRTFLSLRGARFLACASEQAPQSPPPPVFARSHRRRSNLANWSEIATPRQVGARNDTPLVFARLTSVSRSNLLGAGIDRPSARNDKWAWCWAKEAATKSWRRDLQMPVSSFYFGDGRESMTRFILLPSLSRCQVITGQDGADEQDDYLCPWSILHKEGGGRSWAINNTSNPSGVE